MIPPLGQVTFSLFHEPLDPLREVLCGLGLDTMLERHGAGILRYILISVVGVGCWPAIEVISSAYCWRVQLGMFGASEAGTVLTSTSISSALKFRSDGERSQANQRNESIHLASGNGECKSCHADGLIDIREATEEQMIRSLRNFLGSDSRNLGDDCWFSDGVLETQFFVGPVRPAPAGVFGQAFSTEVVSLSELFSPDHPKLWLKFTLTIESSAHTSGWDGQGRWFIVDALRYSPRGLCFFENRAPLPSNVHYTFPDSDRMLIEGDIKSAIENAFRAD